MLQLIFILVNFCFSFVLNSLEYITIHYPRVLFASSVSSWTLLQWWFYYSFKIIPSLKTWLKHAYLHRSVDVKFIFNSARLGLFSSAKILQMADVAFRFVFLLFLPCEVSEWTVRHFSFHNENNSTSSPGLLG